MFKNANEKRDAITHLPTLKAHPAWKFIEQAIDDDVAQLKQDLRQRKDYTSLEEVYFLQNLIDATEAFKVLPDKIVALAKEEPLETEDEEIYDLPQTDK